MLDECILYICGRLYIGKVLNIRNVSKARWLQTLLIALPRHICVHILKQESEFHRHLRVVVDLLIFFLFVTITVFYFLFIIILEIIIIHLIKIQ